jgi:hypothetical protein
MSRGFLSIPLSTSLHVSDWMFMLEESASCALAGDEGRWRGMVVGSGRTGEWMDSGGLITVL